MKATQLSHGVLAVLLGGVFLAGCDDHITVDRDPSVSVRKGMTWAWRPQAPPKADRRRVVSRDVISREYPAPAPDQDSQILRDRLKIAFQQVLSSKGLVQVDDPARADFLVDYHVGIRARRATVATPAYAPVLVCGYYGCWESWGPGYWGPPEIIRTVRYHEGTLVFSLVRNDDNRLAFRAISQKVVTRESFNPDHAYDAAKHMLKDLKPAQ